MIIYTKQIDAVSLGLFVANYVSGGFLSGALQQYFVSSGWDGPNVAYITGTSLSALQTFNGPMAFAISPTVPYSGGSATGTAPSLKFVTDYVGQVITGFSGFATGSFVDIYSVQTIGGSKTFTGQTFVAWPLSSGATVPQGYIAYVSGLLQSGITTVTVPNVAHTTGNETLSGVKAFASPPTVPPPSGSGDAVNKYYADNVGASSVFIVNTTGNQTVSGIKTFLQSPVVPVAVTSNQAPQLAQLQALGNTIGGVTGFAGVIDINGTSGASGHVYLQGAGTVSVIQCGPIFYVSGLTANNTQFYSARVLLASGTTGFSFVYQSGFPVLPTVVGVGEISGGFPVSFVGATVYNSTTGGFSVALNTASPSGYVYSFDAVPTFSGGSGFLGLQGAAGVIGPSLTPRGNWTSGTIYNALDVVYVTGGFVQSYIATNTALATNSNQPTGSGNANWQILASGVSGVGPQGPVGPTGGISLSGTITGNFVNMSFFFDPVYTGLNVVEAFSSFAFTATGYAVSCRTSGFGPTNGGIFSGTLYQVDFNNTQQTITGFTLSSGVIYSSGAAMSILVSGRNRVGLSITNTLSGLGQLTIGVFGLGI